MLAVRLSVVLGMLFGAFTVLLLTGSSASAPEPPPTTGAVPEPAAVSVQAPDPGSAGRLGVLPPPAADPLPAATPEARGERPAIAWRRSRAIGRPNAGRLVAGVQLPPRGRDYWTWDPVHKTKPNRGWRRWGTDRLVRVVLRTLRDYRRRNPDAPRVGIGDLSRPRGGDFGARFGSLGHASHQNGLDVDLYYPRLDRRLRRPHAPELVDRRLAQELVDAFVRAGVRFVFVGPRLGLSGPPRVVQPLRHHDDHIHVRLR